MNKLTIFIINDFNFGGHVNSFLTQFEILSNDLDYMILASDGGHIFKNKSKYKYIDQDKIQYYDCKNIRKYNFCFDLFKSIKKNIKYKSTLHLYSPECYFTASLFKSQKKDTKLILSTMGGVYAFPFYKSADLHIAVSHEQINKCNLGHNNHGLIANRISVNKNKILMESYEELIDKRKNIYLISRLDYDKSIPLKNSLHILKHLSSKYNIYILGDGEYKKDFCTLLKKENISVNFEGMVSNPLKYVKDCALVLGMGRSIIEFMLNGYPAILVGYDGSIDLFYKNNVKQAFYSNFSGRDIYNNVDLKVLKNKNFEKKYIFTYLNEQYNIEYFKNSFNHILCNNKNKEISIFLVFLEYLHYNILRLKNKIRRLNVKNK